jgi:hypothetical protein
LVMSTSAMVLAAAMMMMTGHGAPGMTWMFSTVA